MSDDILAALRARARDAAPAAPGGAHLDEVVLARVRAGEESESLDDAYRHVASCAICRARLTDDARGEALVRAAFPAPAAVVARARRPAARSFGYLLAAAAMLSIVALLFVRKPAAPLPLVVTQRSFVGTMGSTTAHTPVPVDDRNVELAIDEKVEAAVVVACDEAGRRISAPETFQRNALGRLVVVLAPRTFEAHVGAPRAWIFAGPTSGVTKTTAALANEPTWSESRVREVAADHDVRVAIVTLDP